MMLIAAATMSLVPILPDDERLKSSRTFVSEQAQAALADPQEGRVLCLDQGSSAEHQHICLTEAQWRKAIALAEEDEAAARRDRLIGLAQWNSGASGSQRLD